MDLSVLFVPEWLEMSCLQICNNSEAGLVLIIQTVTGGLFMRLGNFKSTGINYCVCSFVRINRPLSIAVEGYKKKRAMRTITRRYFTFCRPVLSKG